MIVDEKANKLQLSLLYLKNDLSVIKLTCEICLSCHSLQYIEMLGYHLQRKHYSFIGGQTIRCGV